MRKLWNRRVWLMLGLVGVALFAQTGVAFATQYFVDGAIGDDTNTCLQPTVGAPPLGPCDTIDHALDLAQANLGSDEVLVADGTYAETLIVGDGTLLRTLDNADPKPVINNSPTASSAVSIAATGGSVDGFEIRSDFRALQVNGPASVTGNSFPTTAAPTANNDVFVFAVTGDVLIAGNGFTDDGVDGQFGIFSNATSATNLTIQNNDFSGLGTAIWLQDGDASPLIAGNDIAGIHDGGAGILVYEGSPQVTGNVFHSKGNGGATGFNISNTNGPAGATLARNQFLGYSTGVSTLDTDLPLRLDSDLIVNSLGFGLFMSDGVPAGTGDVIATNVTIYDSGTGPVSNGDAALTLDSSIIGGTIVTSGGAPTCTIDFSRGPTLVGPANGCGSFQTTADPMFVTPGTNYRLQMGSPMIDAGNDLTPPLGTLDVDGNPRALSSTPACTLTAGRRDMGADEFVPATGVGCPVPPTITPTPAASPPKKKCKKGRKLKKGKCVKKKRKKL